MKHNITRCSSRSLRLAAGSLAVLAAVGGLSSCEEEESLVGGGIRPSEVTITVDSTTFDLKGQSVAAPEIDSRSTTTLLGSINTSEYGKLRCSFVTQLLPAQEINLSEDIKPSDIDSVKLILRIPRASITGDTLAPQQATVYRLTQQLPADINSSYDPTGKYSLTPLGRRNYTLSEVAMGTSANVQRNVISLQIKMPTAFGADALRQYREDPSMFLWPQTFAKEFPGLFVDATFGKGCIASITALNIYVYTHHETTVTEVVDKETVEKKKIVRDSTCFFASAPEVLSSNVISYTPSKGIHDLVAEGKSIITTPGGYTTRIIFPAKELLATFRSHGYDLAVINSLSMSIPAEKISNNLGIGVPPTLLMVKASEADAFFAESKVPDSKSSFILKWNSTNGCYKLSSMRSYITELAAAEGEIDEKDTEFMLIPVTTVSETITNSSDGSTSEVYTSCVPYLSTPTMTVLNTDKATIVFTFSNQTFN